MASPVRGRGKGWAQDSHSSLLGRARTFHSQPRWGPPAPPMRRWGQAWTRLLARIRPVVRWAPLHVNAPRRGLCNRSKQAFPPAERRRGSPGTAQVGAGAGPRPTLPGPRRHLVPAPAAAPAPPRSRPPPRRPLPARRAAPGAVASEPAGVAHVERAARSRGAAPARDARAHAIPALGRPRGPARAPAPRGPPSPPPTAAGRPEQVSTKHSRGGAPRSTRGPPPTQDPAET